MTEQHLAVGLADTPQVQRLAVTVTLLLDAEGAKGLAAAITKTAEGMSASGLVVAGGVLNGAPR